MHQFPRSAVRTGTDWAQSGPPVCPHRPRSLPVRDRAAKLRRIDGAGAGHPHDRRGAWAEPAGSRPVRGRRRRGAAAGAGGQPPQQARISVRWVWRHPRIGLAPGPCPCRSLVRVHLGASPPAGGVDSRQTASRACADAPALSRCHPVACFANSPRPCPTNACHGRGDRARVSRPNPVFPTEFRRLFVVCPLNSAAPAVSVVRLPVGIQNMVKAGPAPAGLIHQPAEHQRGVGAAKSERVRQCDIDVALSRPMRHQIDGRLH